MEGLDVVEDHEMSLGAGGGDGGAEAFGFERGPKGLHGGVVVTVALAAHALGDLAEVEALAEGGAGILAASVAVVEQVSKCGCWPCLEGAFKGLSRQLGGEAGVGATGEFFVSHGGAWHEAALLLHLKCLAHA